MLDSTFLKEDKELMDYLDNVTLPKLKEKMKDDSYWKLEDYPMKKILYDDFKEHFNEDYKTNNIEENTGKLSRYVYSLTSEKIKMTPQTIFTNNIKGYQKGSEPELWELLKKHFKKVYYRRGWNWWKPQNWMAYHTNAEITDYWRVYFVWADEDNKSFLRYYDRDNDKVITAWDKKGWNINYFKIGKKGNDNPHCIWSDCNRLSAGFKVWNG